LSESDLDNLRGQGWVLPDTLPGGMDRYAAKVLDDEGRQVVQVSYSDGLFSASLFVQRGGLDADRLKGFHRERVGDSVMYVRAGLLRTLVWTGVAGDDASSSAVYTLVLDAPEEDGPPIVAALPHAPLGDDLAARLDRGLDRVRSWANPFA
jgi:sigma-E factor negative regulatory protein RseB